MNLAALFLAASLSLPAFAATTFQGEYHLGFLRDVPATLTVTNTQHGLTTSLRAPQAECVVRFGPGTYTGEYDGHAVYVLPIIQACDSPTASTFRLFINSQSAKIRGSNGRMSWTYFSSGNG